MDGDLAKIAQWTSCIRIYSLSGPMERIVPLAEERGISVVAGAWISGDMARNRREMDALFRLTASHRNIIKVFIGNETLLKNLVSLEVLSSYLQEARSKLKIPVSTGEPPVSWTPELIQNVDFIGLHMLPYWGKGVPEAQAVEAVVKGYRELRDRSGGKPVWVAEIGWPSIGPQRRHVVANLENEVAFIKSFMARAAQDKISYNVFEAFDEAWKVHGPGGRAEAHFGLMDAFGRSKLETRSQGLKWIAILFCVVWAGGLGFSGFVFEANLLGHLFGQAVVQSGLASLVFFLKTASAEYMLANWICIALLAALVLLLFYLFVRAIEAAEVIGRKPLRRLASSIPLDPSWALPFVSIHVPCRNEDPEMVIETARSLLDLDYPRYEVLIIDNNTSDPGLWKPLEAFAKRHPSVIRFHHVDRLQGYKAGALNYALKATSADAELIALVDSDYRVEKDWLSSVVPLFQGKGVGGVQAPQAYLEKNLNPFQELIHAEYRGFFQIGMVQRNERNALIQHGTMLVLRRNVLEAVGGWDERSITEDTELGLRILEHGHEIVYLNRVFGRGVIPTSFSEYSKQRFRWVYGAFRILRSHWRPLFGLKPGLTAWQRYHFIAGWLPWAGDALYPMFSFVGILGTALIFFDDRRFPPVEFLYPLFVFFLARLAIVYSTHRVRLGAGLREVVRSMVAGGALVNTVAAGVWFAAFGSAVPFRRTRKTARPRSKLTKVLFQLKWELGFSLGLMLCMGKMIETFGLKNTQSNLWVVALLIQTIPSLLGIYACVLSERCAVSEVGS